MNDVTRDIAPLLALLALIGIVGAAVASFIPESYRGYGLSILLLLMAYTMADYGYQKQNREQMLTDEQAVRIAAARAVSSKFD